MPRLFWGGGWNSVSDSRPAQRIDGAHGVQITSRYVLIGAQIALPCPVIHGVGADRPEIRAPADEHAISQHEYAAVAAPHAVEHMDVNRVESILHG